MGQPTGRALRDAGVRCDVVAPEARFGALLRALRERVLARGT
jgi:uroporphyrinogen-III synthase